MDRAGDSGTEDLLSHVLVPVAHEDDARATAEALDPYDPEAVTVVHVVEKGEGVPDKTPVEQSEEVAAASFDAFREVFPEAAERNEYSRDVVDAIFSVADEVGASAIVFRSRGGGRIMQFLSGDVSLRLVTQAALPVIALPRRESSE